MRRAFSEQEEVSTIRDFKTQAEEIRRSPNPAVWDSPSQYWKGGGKPKYAQFDFETYCDVDIGECGAYRYIEDDSFEPLMVACAFDDEEVFIIDFACGEDLPGIVWEAIFDPGIIKTAWNAQFERTIFGKMAGRKLSPDSWRDTAVWAASLSLPLKLETAAEVVQGEQKDKEGKRLINYFSVPCKPTKKNGGRTRNLPEHAPEDWEKFKQYCLQDVRTERDIRIHLERFRLVEHEWDFYHMDQRINDRGVMIDMALVRQAIACDADLSNKMLKQAVALTGLDNPNSISQLKSWLEKRGVSVDSLDKKSVAAMITDLDKHSLDSEALEMLKLREQMAKSSVKKYQAAERYVCSDGRAHGLFQFAGANRTARWAGRGIQLQSLPQNHIDTLEEARDLVKWGCFDLIGLLYGNTPGILSQLLRTMIVPKPGCALIVVDYSAIEARVLAWLAGEQWRIDSFTNGADIYCASASQMFGVPVVKHGINGDLRQKGKVAELACGYGGGVGALKGMGALDMGLKEKELPGIITRWRESNAMIVKYWRDIEKAANDTAVDHNEKTVGKVEFQFYEKTLWIKLPSGRSLAYPNPTREPNKYGIKALNFDGLGLNNKWTRQETYGGKLVENITQATARDLLAEAMWRMERAGLPIIGHVHDEVILEVPEGSITVDEVSRIMNQNPSWADGLPLSSAGYLAPKFYFKD